MYFKKLTGWIVITFFSLILTACGGGDSDAPLSNVPANNNSSVFSFDVTPTYQETLIDDTVPIVATEILANGMSNTVTQDVTIEEKSCPDANYCGKQFKPKGQVFHYTPEKIGDYVLSVKYLNFERLVSIKSVSSTVNSMNVTISSNDIVVGNTINISTYALLSDQSSIDVTTLASYKVSECRTQSSSCVGYNDEFKSNDGFMKFTPNKPGVYVIKVSYSGVERTVTVNVADVNVENIIMNSSSIIGISNSSELQFSVLLDNGQTLPIDVSDPSVVSFVYNNAIVDIDQSRSLITGKTESTSTSLEVTFNDYKGDVSKATFLLSVIKEPTSINVDTSSKVISRDESGTLLCTIVFKDATTSNDCALLKFTADDDDLVFDLANFTFSSSKVNTYNITAKLLDLTASTSVEVRNILKITKVENDAWPSVIPLNSVFTPLFDVTYNDGSQVKGKTLISPELNGKYTLEGGLTPTGGGALKGSVAGIAKVVFQDVNTSSFQSVVSNSAVANIGIVAPDSVVAGDEFQVDLAGTVDGKVTTLTHFTNQNDWSTSGVGGVVPGRVAYITTAGNASSGVLNVNVTYSGQVYSKTINVLAESRVQSLNISLPNSSQSSQNILSFGQSLQLTMTATLDDLSIVKVHNGTFILTDNSVLSVTNSGRVLGKDKSGSTDVTLQFAAKTSNTLTFNVIDEAVSSLEFSPSDINANLGDYITFNLNLYTIGGHRIPVSDYVLKFDSGENLLLKSGNGYYGVAEGLVQGTTSYKGRTAAFSVTLSNKDRVSSYIVEKGVVDSSANQGDLFIASFTNRTYTKDYTVFYFDPQVNQYVDLTNSPNTVWSTKLIQGNSSALTSIVNGTFSASDSAIDNIYDIEATNLGRTAKFRLYVREGTVSNFELKNRLGDKFDSLQVRQSSIVSNITVDAFFSDGTVERNMTKYLTSILVKGSPTLNLPKVNTKRVTYNGSGVPSAVSDNSVISIIAGNAIGNFEIELAFDLNGVQLSKSFALNIVQGVLFSHPSSDIPNYTHISTGAPFGYFLTSETTNNGGYSKNLCVQTFDNVFPKLGDDSSVINLFNRNSIDTIQVQANNGTHGNGTGGSTSSTYYPIASWVAIFPTSTTWGGGRVTYKGRVESPIHAGITSNLWVQAGSNFAWSQSANAISTAGDTTLWPGLCQVQFKSGASLYTSF
ncbi:hypothetical protein QFW85_26865 [Vibrio chagasii]|uniref:hypothetical protein n=1 Tax=Vibrio chagasii TaxID=170679 RepID=UPI003DA8BC68